MTEWRNGLQGKAMIGLGSDKKQTLKTIHSTAGWKAFFVPLLFTCSSFYSNSILTLNALGRGLCVCYIMILHASLLTATK